METSPTTSIGAFQFDVLLTVSMSRALGFESCDAPAQDSTANATATPWIIHAFVALAKSRPLRNRDV